MTYPLITCSESDASITVPQDGGAVLIGRSTRADLHIASRHCSREQARIRWSAEGGRLEPLSQNVPTLVDGETVNRPVRLRHGAEIAFGPIVLHYLEHPDSSANTLERTLTPVAGLDDVEPLGDSDLDLRGGGIVGRSSGCEFLLEHPQVSRRHASIGVRSDGTWIEDLGSANGTYVEGERLSAPRKLARGERVDIGPFSLEFQGDRFARSSPQGKVRLVVERLTRRVPGQEASKVILDEVSLVAEPGEFLVILGPSGSGKSTLMSALGARHRADEGRVVYNGIDLYGNFEALKHGIAYVPQRELLHEDLTLREALAYTANLRLPGDTPPEERRTRVEAALARVDLVRQADTHVRALSGGQRKKASLASETLCEPHLLFVDEVTSGLDEQADWDMMRLLRRIAERGETVVCVTHNLGNVQEFAHKVAVLGRGGCLAFFGTPKEAGTYFEVERLGEIYGKLARHEGSYWKQRYLESEHFGGYMGDQLEALAGDSAQRAVLSEGIDAESVPVGSARRRRPGAREVRRQLPVLLRRYLTLIARDRRVLGLAFGQSLLIGIVLLLAFSGAELPGGGRLELFLLGVSCFWFGCSNASKEIVKERGSYEQERDVNLSLLGYLGSKLGGLLALGGLQVLLLFLVDAWRHSAGALPGVLATMFLALTAGTALGLALSSRSRTPDQATTLVPIVLIPQIVLSGALVPEMNGLATFLAEALVAGHWIERAMAASVGAPDAGSGLLAGVFLGLHALVYAGLAYLVLVRDARREPTAPLRWGRLR